MTEGKPKSSYEEFLPALLQGDPVVGQFLQAFEKVLTGSQNPQSSSFKLQRLQSPKPDQQADALPGLEEVIRNMHLYLMPYDPDRDNPSKAKDKKNWQETPSEFLPWLAGWVALSLRDDWPELTKRQFIREMVPLYKLRGTKPGLEKILTLYLESLKFTKSKVTVYDQFRTKPNYFQVELTLPYPDPDLYWQQARIAKGIIDQEKPAHTYYALRILTPSMRITGQMYPFSIGGMAQPSRALPVPPRVLGPDRRESSVAQPSRALPVPPRGLSPDRRGFSVAQPSEVLPAVQITRIKTFWITVTKVVNPGASTAPTTEPPTAVPLIIGLNARSSSPLHTQLRPQMFPMNQPVKFEVRAEFQSEAEGWQITLRNAAGNSTVTLKLQPKEILQADNPFYLSLNNLNPYRVEVQVGVDGETDGKSLELQPPLRIYRLLPNSTKPNPSSGNTLIGTQTHP